MAALYRALLAQVTEGDDLDTKIDADSLVEERCAGNISWRTSGITLCRIMLANLKKALGGRPKRPRTEAKSQVYPALPLQPASSSTSTSPDVAVSPSISFIQKPFIIFIINRLTEFCACVNLVR